MIENFYKRASFRMNLDNKVNDIVSISEPISHLRTAITEELLMMIPIQVLSRMHIGASPLMPVYNPDGSYSDYTQYQASWLSDNPVKSAKEVKAFTTNYRFIGTVFAEVQILQTRLNSVLHSM